MLVWIVLPSCFCSYIIRDLVELGLEGNILLPSIYQLGVSATRAHLSETSPQRNVLTTPPSPILHDWEIDWKDLKFGVLLGEGAFGRVYEGIWQGRLVAIKKILGELDDKALREFRREVGILSKLKPHPNLVTYYGACTQFPHLYIVTEYISRYVPFCSSTFVPRSFVL